MERKIKHQQDIIRIETKRFSLGIAMALCLPAAEAAEITKWNLGNVTTESPPYIPGETYNSFVYTDDTKTLTNGGIIWVEGDVQAPGTRVFTDGDPAADTAERGPLTRPVPPHLFLICFAVGQ